ncbi:DNA-binding response regulator [Ahniella affigens]|uniref:DNA-binding response regulator n=1 Tax=Ahniella affigens TaxID=2021234 RepID=A0A2P1PXE7_9GAMM|nr:LytTR family DNA-binding domain-containing protein [Ahniella affigens]AVP99515.1 DNA-binding response regulator [Ahniella affigens]
MPPTTDDQELRALLVEDEAPQRQALMSLLAAQWPTLSITVCEDGIAALEAIATGSFHIAFLDIRLPGADGLRVARALPASTQIVFTTAYDQHAIAAFEAGALDYLLKPITEDRLARTVLRIRERLAQVPPPMVNGIDALQALRQRDAKAPLRWISASVGDSVRLIGIDEVFGFQAKDKYTRVLTHGGEAIIRLSLRELLDQLDPDAFWQVHRSLIVRVAAIDRAQKDELGNWRLRLRGLDEWFPVSQAFAGKFRGM